MNSKSLLFLFLFLCSCSGLEQSEQEKIRRQNAKGEFIYRKSNETFYSLTTPKQQLREKYPWEESYVGSLSKISKEFFRCKGSSLNPSYSENSSHVSDCGGFQKHSLPLREDKEYVYPILVDLLNYIQTKTGKKVVITCGHRCPIHNSYADRSNFNQTSKHMIGAEVDFYVQGMEDKPEEVIKLLMQFYRENPAYQGNKELQQFLRYEKKDTNVSTPPWYNKEILIKLFKKSEGRDFDNRHPYPYLCLQVRFDKSSNEKVTYSWEKAFNGYKRF